MSSSSDLSPTQLPLNTFTPFSQSNWWKGDDYHNNSQPQFILAKEVLLKYIFKGDEKVLDIGCGDGEVTKFIAKEKVPFGSIVGIDASSSMIESAIINNSIYNINYQIGLAESFQFDNLFDLIVSFSAIHWVVDQQAVWNNIRMHLKIGGHALISLNPQPRKKEFAEAINEVIKSSQFYSFFCNYFPVKNLMPLMSINEYEYVIIQSGLRVDECKQSFKYFEYESKSVFINNVKAWLPYVAQVPKELQDEFVTLIITKFLVKTNQKEIGIVKLEYNNFMIQATRIS